MDGYNTDLSVYAEDIVYILRCIACHEECQMRIGYSQQGRFRGPEGWKNMEAGHNIVVDL